MSGDIAKLRWYRGPWQWNTSEAEMPHWKPPTGAVGSIDLRSLPDQSAAGTSAGLGMFVSYDALPSEYDLLGVGSPRDIKPGQKTKDAIPKRSRFSVQGDDLLSMLRSCLMDGSDPTGGEYAKPLMPGNDMRFGFCIGPWRDWEKTAPWNAHWDKVQDVLRADFKDCFDDAMAGRLNDNQQHLRVLDALCEKYRVDDWKAFVPLSIRGAIPGRVPHQTSYSDDFNRADSTSLGSNWTETNSNCEIFSNQLRAASGDASNPQCRWNSDLSSSDNYSSIDVISRGATDTSYVGPMCRFQSAASTAYLSVCRGNAARGLFKLVTGTFTSLISGSIGTAPFNLKVQANGSSIAQYLAGSSTADATATDTAISSGLRGGIQFRGISTSEVCDNFVASDIAASSILYTQLEGGTRGLARGMWHRSGN